MKKWVIDVKEHQVVDGEHVTTCSCHTVEATTALEARLLFVARAFPNEKVVGVREAETLTKASKPVKH
jgi:hypothetical protein